MKHVRIFGIALLFALATVALFAQSDLGTITGFVKDPSGATIPGATVVVKSEATGTERRACQSGTSRPCDESLATTVTFRLSSAPMGAP